MEWNPEHEDQNQFWPGEETSRRPRWLPILIAAAAVSLIISSVIWFIGRDSGDDENSADETSETSSEAGSAATTTLATTTTLPFVATPDGSGADDDRSAAVTTTLPDVTTTVGATTTTLTTVPLENPGQFGPSTLSNSSTVSTVGLDSVNFGMSVNQAQQAAGTVLVPAGPTGSCYHVVPADAPEGIVFLVHEGTIERVDINSGPITTRSGVGVGSPETLVTDLFGDSIEREVRVDGTVDLVFVPRDPGDDNYRVVFNIADGAVRAFKSGRLPQIMLDTGCEQP